MNQIIRQIKIVTRWREAKASPHLAIEASFIAVRPIINDSIKPTNVEVNGGNCGRVQEWLQTWRQDYDPGLRLVINY